MYNILLGEKKITIKHADYSMENPWKQKLNKFLEEIQQNQHWIMQSS